MTSIALAREEVFNNDDPLRAALNASPLASRAHLTTVNDTVKKREKRLAACTIANIAEQHTQQMQLSSDSLFKFIEKLEAYVKEHSEIDAKIETNEEGESEGTITVGDSELVFKNEGINLVNPTRESIRRALEILLKMLRGSEIILGINGSDAFMRMVDKELATGKYPNIKVNQATQSKMEKLGFKNLANYERNDEADDHLITKKKAETGTDVDTNDDADAINDNAATRDILPDDGAVQGRTASMK